MAGGHISICIHRTASIVMCIYTLLHHVTQIISIPETAYRIHTHINTHTDACTISACVLLFMLLKRTLSRASHSVACCYINQHINDVRRKNNTYTHMRHVCGMRVHSCSKLFEYTYCHIAIWMSIGYKFEQKLGQLVHQPECDLYIWTIAVRHSDQIVVNPLRLARLNDSLARFVSLFQTIISNESQVCMIAVSTWIAVAFLVDTNMASYSNSVGNSILVKTLSDE